MSIANTIGSSIGSSAAYAKHGVLMTGIGGSAFVVDTIDAVRAQYAAKDAELSARREAAKAARAAVAVEVPMPKRQRRIVTA